MYNDHCAYTNCLHHAQSWTGHSGSYVHTEYLSYHYHILDEI